MNSTVFRHYCKQRSAVTENTKIVRLPKRSGRFFRKIRSTEHVRIPQISRDVITVQTEREGSIFVTSRTTNGKLMEGSAARRTQNTKRNETFCIIVNYSNGEKETNSKIQVTAAPETAPKLMLAMKQTTGELLGVV